MKLSFVQKLWLPLVLSLFCLAGLSFYNAYHTRDVRLEERKADLKHASEIALSEVKSFAAAAATGAMTPEDAKKLALESVRNIRYGESGYFTLLNSHPTVLMHPMKPEMNGKDVGSYRDPNGVALYIDAVKVTQNGAQGFTTFSFPRPGSSEPVPKISYNVSYQPWDWILMTGVYVDDIDAAFHASLLQSFGILLALAIVLSGVVVVLNRGIMRSLGGEPSYAAQIASRIADNDLTAVVNTVPGDRTSLLFSMKRMQEQLTGTINAIKTSAGSIATATSQIAAGNQDLSQRTEEQAASLQETAASMEELTSTVTQNADNARQASQLAVQAAEVASQGSGVVSRVVETMEGINRSSDKIADIVGIIEGIAFQTNILALNAAVEAARAGEQGRGFAVVASEVRSLAQRSATASKEVKELIQDSVQRVQAGRTYVEEAGTTMDEITRAVKRVTDIMGEIAAASTEQSKGIGQVNQAVTQMDEVTQQNAALVEQAAAAANSLATQAGDLKASVSTFKLQPAHA
ncbi:Methyl-accepting chemotaxis protein [Burkholderia sp. 8Y]|uniref:methyl-accepting chemotaxis protein n=1 Tax=Burkholderia sp. 8Y TaxID=2653133 RepID=UPI0012EF3B83|nr:methyl-accepting chemotaxis protein [Burkholderia sp. 8Y]VXB58453.1 Methyl-accepting chemotaxis protein [Burkholderia sp. 8Y]